MSPKKDSFDVSVLELKKKGSKDLSKEELTRKVRKEKGTPIIAIPKRLFADICRILGGEVYVEWTNPNPFVCELKVRFFKKSGSSAINQKKDSDCHSDS